MPAPLNRRIDLKDAASGLVLVLIAGWFAATALKRLPLGTPSNMGPGYFPTAVAIGLGAMGLFVLARAFGAPTPEVRFAPLRSVACILGAPILFALAIQPLGFVPAIALTAFLAAFGSRNMTMPMALALTAGLTAATTLIFVKMLRMPVAIFGPMLDF